MDLLDELDEVVHAFGLEKIKTVGDGYLAVAGIQKSSELDVVAAVGAGVALHRAVAEVSERRGRALSLRVGVARGEAMAAYVPNPGIAADGSIDAELLAPLAPCSDSDASARGRTENASIPKSRRPESPVL